APARAAGHLRAPRKSRGFSITPITCSAGPSWRPSTPPPCARTKGGTLKVSDIDSQRMVLPVRHGKGSIPRDIALSPVLLERWRVWFRWRRPSDWLFPSKRHPDQLLDDASIRVLCRTAGSRAGRPRLLVHPHCFGPHAPRTPSRT